VRDGGQAGTSRGAKTEQDIYAAAVRLMSERGYHGTSQRSIAVAVGLQMSSLYHHFPSKQDLLVAIMTRAMQDLISTVEDAVASADGEGPEERLRAAIRGHILFHADRRQEAFILDSELRALEPEGRDLVVKLRDQYEQIFVGILREGMSEGVFGVPDTKLAVFVLMAMCTGVALWYRPGGRLPLEVIADIYADLFLRGVLTSEQATGVPGRLHGPGASSGESADTSSTQGSSRQGGGLGVTD